MKILQLVTRRQHRGAEVFAAQLSDGLVQEGHEVLLVGLHEQPWDPLEPLPHDPDIKALLRLAVVWNIPIACNRATADFLFSSPLMSGDYKRKMPDFYDYNNRKIE